MKTTRRRAGSGALGVSRVALVGAGAMGEAMIGGLIRNRLIDPRAIVASHPRSERARELESRLGIQTVPENRAAVHNAEVVVLAVKPQVLRSVFKELRGALAPSSLVLSVVAGARIESIVRGLDHKIVVRSMPNTPAQVGEGMTIWTATPTVREKQREQARMMLRALGRELYVEDEVFLDMATAISGTGPTYVFLLMEALIDAAVHLGFSRRDAREIVIQTVKGAAMFTERSSLHPAEMRNMVTSPGGTSAEALYQLEKGAFRTVLSKAVWAAYQRSVSLGALNSSVPAFEPVEKSGESG